MLAAVEASWGTQEKEKIDAIEVSVPAFSIACKAGKDLSATLAVADIAYLVLTSLLADIVNEGGLIVPAQFTERVMPELAVGVRVQIPVMSRVAAAPRIIQPNVEATLCKEERHTVLTIVKSELA